MEPRKRPLPDEDEHVVNKKRILTGANGSPHVNGGAVDEDESDFREKLESYRKEAIYRKMMHYSREHHRSKARIQELERRKTTCEAGVAAISACWAQLVETIRLFVKTDDLPEVSIRAKEIFDLTIQIQDDPPPEFSAALGDTLNATQALVTKFVQLGGDNQPSFMQNKAFPEYQQAQNECVLLRSELTLLRTRLQESETQRENYHNALIAAENRYERSRSSTVRDVETKKKVGDQEGGMGEIEETLRKPSSPAPSSVATTPVIQQNGFHDTSSEIEILVEQLRSRDSKIVELEKEAALLRDEKTMLTLEYKAPSVEQVLHNPHVRILLDYQAYMEASLAEKTSLVETLREELQQLQTVRTSLEEACSSSSNQTIQELKNMVGKRDQENARLREQREQQNSELVERRQRDHIKFASIQEYKALLESNSERIKVLQSELSRCKAHLAASTGAEDLLNFFLGGEHDEVKFLEDLKDRKTQAELRVAALEQTLEGYDDNHTDLTKHMKAEANALERLSHYNIELEKYRKTYGDLSSLPPDVSRLAEQLRVKEAELEKLRLKERQHQENESSLFSELEKLSTLWESLDRQLKSKVFELSSMEERVTKLSYEKAKSDNKFYASMREKDAIETERKNLARTLDKQNKVLDHLRGKDKQMQLQINNFERQCAALRKGTEFLDARVHQLEKECPDLKSQLETEKLRLHELTALVGERETVLQTKRAELRSKEDEFIRFKKDLERQMTQVKREARTEVNHSKPSILDSEAENAVKLVNCSICKDTVRTTIITKCMHTFCRGCVDARLSTRQRKCPACNLPFGVSDVHQFFMQ